LSSLGIPASPVTQIEPGARQARLRRKETGRAQVWYRDRWQVVYLYIMWATLLTDPHRWIAQLGLPFFHRVLTIMFVPVIAMVLFRLPVLLSQHGNKIWYIPLLLYVGVAVLGVPFAVNHGVAQIAARLLVLNYIYALAVFSFINTPRRVVIFVTIYLCQYLWWALHSGVSGVVIWHPDYANSDGFGPLALLGLATTYHFAKAARGRKMRRLAYLLAAWAVIGIVASFARGVMLSMGLVAGVMWLRSPNKGRMTLVMLGGLALIVIGAQFIVPTVHTGNEFTERDRPHGGIAGLWAEVMSSFTEGASEGTGNDRWELWKAALIVFQHDPVIGAGAQNVGIAAAEIVQVGEIGSIYSDNPARLWGRQLHNIYFQILSEFGLLGTAAYLTILIDFWRKNARMRRRNRNIYWDAVSGGQWSLYWLALGLEITMVSFLATGFFYNTLYLFSSFALLILNRLLYMHSTPPRQPAVLRGAGPPRPVPPPLPA
jgi:O-antigen ligase